MKQSRLEMLESLRTDFGRTMELRQQYPEKPITMHKTHPSQKPMFWPAVIRQAYAAIWSGFYRRVIIKAPRGGGKSKLLGTAGFDLWYLKHRNVVAMGGSLVQAEIVYGYFTDYCAMDQSVSQSIQGEITQSATKAAEGHTFSCVTASPKQVRGKHPDVLISDETCETSDELIDSALPMVNDSKNPLVVMASTFHKIFGRFGETWDNAEQYGYHRIQWDAFDVCKTFDPAIWTKPEYVGILGIEKLKAKAKGRTGDPEGWIPVENIIQAWREKPTEDWFDVEYMGTRPSSAGLVLKPEDVDAAVFDSDADLRYNFIQGATSVLGIDWGFSSMTAMVEAMGYRDGLVSVLHNENFHQINADEIIAAAIVRVKAHGIRFIYADSAGKFENASLQSALAKERLGCAVIEVVFSKEKDGMLGNLRAHFEQRKIKLPKKFRDAFYQLKNYRYQEGTDKVVKKDDHIPDALQCALQHFILGQFARPMSLPETAKPQTEETSKNITAGLLKKQF